MAAREGRSAWDIAKFYQEDFERDLARLNVQQKAHPRATEYVEAMIEWGQRIADKHCYEIDSGLYFDVSTVADYGRLARAVTEDGEGRIESVEGKRNAADFAIWRRTPPGETRQMEWDSPWGRGAPGWHLECSVMGEALLGFPFDIHTGGIDHREIHHPNEIAQNQAYCCTNGLDHADNSGARIWMHNNFLVDRTGKMSKSSGEFLRLQLLIDKGYHPLAYRLMCLQAHYRSELEFSWEGLGAALTRLKRMVMGVEKLKMAASNSSLDQEDVHSVVLDQFEGAISDDLNTPRALGMADATATSAGEFPATSYSELLEMDEILGLSLGSLTRADLRIRPKDALITETEIERALDRRKEARAAKDFATSDAIRDELAAKGVEVMDGDPLGWEWKL
jgi:cysteinyl-tRNA synthetase